VLEVIISEFGHVNSMIAAWETNADPSNRASTPLLPEVRVTKVLGSEIGTLPPAIHDTARSLELMANMLREKGELLRATESRIVRLSLLPGSGLDAVTDHHRQVRAMYDEIEKFLGVLDAERRRITPAALFSRV